MRPSLTPLIALFALAACSHTPDAMPGVTGQMPLAPVQNADGLFANDVATNTLVYRAPDLDVSRYRGFIVLPTAIYDGSDAEWGDTSPQERAQLAQQLTAEFRRALGQRHRVVDRPGPGIVALQLTLAGIGKVRPVASLTRLTPVGLGMTVVNTAAGLPAAFTGSITLAGKLTDSATGAVLGGFLTKESPDAFDVRSTGGTMTSAGLSASKAAADFTRGIDRAMVRAKTKSTGKAPS